MLIHDTSNFNKAFKESFSRSPIGLVIMDVSGKFLEANEAFCKMLDYSLEELLALDFPSITYAGDIHSNLEKLWALLDGKTSHFLAEKRYVRKDGCLVWARSNVTLIKDQIGNAEALIAIVQNIDDIKQSERLLKDAMSYRDVFLRFASHELRTPMTSIKLNAQMLMRTLSSESDIEALHSKIQDLAKSTDVGINRINRLIDNMLYVSQIQVKSLNLNSMVVNLETVIRSVTSKYAPDLSKAKINHHISAPEKFNVLGDPELLEAVFSNLISNTISYASASELTINLQRKDTEVEISYRNTGPVIPERDQGAIFQRFDLLKSVTNVKGTGLGLFVVKNLVEAHHGTILLNPDSSGAEFIIRFKLI